VGGRARAISSLLSSLTAHQRSNHLACHFHFRTTYALPSILLEKHCEWLMPASIYRRQNAGNTIFQGKFHNELQPGVARGILSRNLDLVSIY
jgi:hypothetical protein